MKLIIPVSSSDLHLLSGFVDVIKALGGVPRHEVTLLPTRDLYPQAAEAAEKLRFCSSSVEVVKWDRDNNGIWPYPGNLMWQHAVMVVGRQEEAGNLNPWYFLELDNCPLVPGWLDKIEAEYAMSGAKFYGAVVPTRVILPDGTFTSDEIIPGFPPNGPHMVGTGIYPPKTHEVLRGLWTAPKQEISWDIMLRYEIRRKGLCATNLIAHHWGTVNYKEDKDGTITCEANPKNPPHFTDHSGAISKTAVIVHGCKDTSLQQIVLKRHPLVAAEPQSTEVEVEVQAAPKPAPKASRPTKPTVTGTALGKKINYDPGLSRALDVSNNTAEEIESAKEAKKPKPAKKKASRWAALA